jgi:flagellar biosynthesis/type III secretory pathway M-ring protein FliF/YscJ
LEYALGLLLLAVLVAFVVARPLRRPGEEAARDEALRADLEAAKEAKYREIRDAELDRDMGKLSHQDWRETDRELRVEATEILRRLDNLGDPGALP